MSHPSANTRSRSATPNNTPVKALPGSVGKMFSSLTLSLTEESEDNVKQAATSLLRVKLFGIFGTNPKAHEDEQTRAEFLSLLEKYTKAERVAADDPILCIASKCFGMKEYKLVLVGGASVGKSAYVEKLKSNRFISKYEPTKKVDVTTLVFNTNQYPIKLDIWDITACFDGYYVGADAAIMMYDVSSKPSMKELNDLYKNLVRVCVGVPIVLTGNKKESSSKRKAKQQNDAVATFSRKNKLKHFGMSTKNGLNFEKPLLFLLKELTGESDLKFIRNEPSGKKSAEKLQAKSSACKAASPHVLESKVKSKKKSPTEVKGKYHKKSDVSVAAAIPLPKIDEEGI